MGKPDDIEQRDWDAAQRLLHQIDREGSMHADERPTIARAIATARDEGRAEQREVDAGRCKQEAELAKSNGLLHEALGAVWCAAAIRKGEP